MSDEVYDGSVGSYGAPMGHSAPEEVTEHEQTFSPKALQFFGMVYLELMKSERFASFFNTNFKVEQNVNEHGEIEFKILENSVEDVAKNIAALAGVPEKEVQEAVKPRKIGKAPLVKTAKASPARDLAAHIRRKIADGLEKKESERTSEGGVRGTIIS